MELVYDNWNKISIETYKNLQNIAKNKDVDAVDTEIAFIAILADVDEEKILDLPVPEFQRLRNKSQFIADFPEIKGKAPKGIVLNGCKYKVVTDISKITTAQYIDFQTYIKLNDMDKYLENILSCFIIPEGKEYNQDYDINETIRTIRECLSIVQAMEISNFFMVAFLKLLNNTLHYSEKQMKKNKKWKTMQEKTLIQKIKETRLMINGLGSLPLMKQAKR